MGSVAVSGSLAFLSCRTGLEVLSLADPTSPTLLGRYSPASAGDFWIWPPAKPPVLVGTTLYWPTGTPGVQVLDLQDPSQPRLEAVIPARETAALAIAADQMLLADGSQLRVVDRLQLDASPGRAEPRLGLPLADQSGHVGQPLQIWLPEAAFLDPGDGLTLAVTLADGAPLPDWLRHPAA